MMKFSEVLSSVNRRYLTWIVWGLRIVIGGLFVMSGLVKGIDIWGFVYKIEEYFAVWQWSVPHSLCVMAALSVAIAEFVLGAMVVVGCYRRVSVWLLIVMMCVMLPLTLYIFISDPVADCGCFGDFWIISNGATFAKNLLISGALVYLAVYNHKVKGVYRPYIQWIPAVGCFVYLLAVALFGYLVQPMIDFRSFPVGSFILPAEVESDDDGRFEFVYEKNGVRQTFDIDNLPDSTWIFVDRTIVGGSDVDDATELVVTEGGNNVTDEVIDTDGDQIIIVLPDYDRANVSYTYAVNELQRYIEKRGGSLIELAAMDSGDIEQWRDLSMATYPIYQAESTVLKELARGVMAAVYIQNGRIVWKRSLSSIELEALSHLDNDDNALDLLAFDSGNMLKIWSLILAVLLMSVLLVDKCSAKVKCVVKSKKNK